MKESEYLLVIIVEKSYTSMWIKWEIERAKQADTNLKFAAVRIKLGNISPSVLPPYTAIANSFELAKIVSALNNAQRSFI